MKRLFYAGLPACFVLIALAGCQHEPVVYAHPNYTPEKWERDKNECIYEAAKHTNPNPYLGTIAQAIDAGLRRNELADLCLKAKGWIRQG